MSNKIKKRGYMKEKYQFFTILAISLTILFFIFIGLDYFTYDESTSFPYYVSIIERSLQFLLPSFVFMILALILKKKKR